MIIDLHCHTLPLSACSHLEPTALLRLATERGLEGICLAEHDRFWDPDELAALRVGSPLPIFQAVEVTTDMGHVLAFGLPPSGLSSSAAELAAAAKRAGALLFLAHPARDGMLRVSLETIEYFASVEAINGSDSRLQNIAASGLARGFRLPGIGGSDAHSAAEVGRAATRFAGDIRTDRDLLDALHAAAYEAVLLE